MVCGRFIAKHFVKIAIPSPLPRNLLKNLSGGGFPGCGGLRGQAPLLFFKRLDGTFSCLEEILELESEDDPDLAATDEHRSEAVETNLYGRTLRVARKAMEDGQSLSKSLIKQMHPILLSFAHR